MLHWSCSSLGTRPAASSDQFLSSCAESNNVKCWLIQMIHAQHNNKNAFKALIAAEYVGVIVQTVPDFKMGVSNKTPEFTQLTPIGKVLLFSMFFSIF